jgi:hypothetical protein
MFCQAKFVLSPKLARLIFTPIEQSLYLGFGKNHNLGVRMGEDAKKWASNVRLVGLFKLQWKAPHHD